MPLQHGRQSQPDSQAALDDGEAGARQRPRPMAGPDRGKSVRERRQRQRNHVDDEPPQRRGAWPLTFGIRQQPARVDVDGIDVNAGTGVRRRRHRCASGPDRRIRRASVETRPGDDPVNDPADGPGPRQLLEHRGGSGGASQQAGTRGQRPQDLHPSARIDTQIRLKIQIGLQDVRRTARGHADHLQYERQDRGRIQRRQRRQLRRRPRARTGATGLGRPWLGGYQRRTPRKGNSGSGWFPGRLHRVALSRHGRRTEVAEHDVTLGGDQIPGGAQELDHSRVRGGFPRCAVSCQRRCRWCHHCRYGR